MKLYKLEDQIKSTKYMDYNANYILFIWINYVFGP